MRRSRLFIFIVMAVLVIGSSFAVTAQEWPDLSGEEIEVTGVWTGNAQTNFEDVLGRFSELTGAEITYSPVGENMATVLGTQIEGGNPPDIAMLPQPGLLRELAIDGDLVPIEDEVGKLVDENYAQVWRDLGSIEGDLYGVWFKAANKSLMWYNANVFEEAGVSEAETWEELMTTADDLYFYGVTPFSIGGASSWTLTDWFENIYLRVAGPENYDKLLNHEIPWTHETVIESLEILKDVFGRPEWLAGGIEGSLEANHPQGIIRPFVEPPEAAMVYGADFSAGAITNETNAELGVDAKFFDFPSINGSPISVVGAGDVAVSLVDNEANMALMRFLATPEAAEIWAAQGGFTSPNKGVDPAVYNSDILRESAKTLQNAEWFRFDLSDLQPSEFGSTAGTGMRFWFQEFLRNPDVERTAEGLEEDAQEAF